MKLFLSKEQEQRKHECPFCSALLSQNRELHERVLALTAPGALVQVTQAHVAEIVAQRPTIQPPVGQPPTDNLAGTVQE